MDFFPPKTEKQGRGNARIVAGGAGREASGLKPPYPA
jgi:hypothetical protein